jgi:ABC-2 type transport system permease protein
MTRLFRVELTRFFARRVTRFVALGLLLGIAAAVIGIAVNSSRDVATGLRRATAEREQVMQSQAAARQDCIAHVPPDQVDQACPPELTDVPPLAAFYRDPRFSFHDHLSDLLHGAVVIGALAALLMSASFIGAEWQAGTFTTLLMWEPRRHRVAAAKVSAAVLASLAIVTVATVLLLGGAALVAATRGTFDSVLQTGPAGSSGAGSVGSKGIGPVGPLVQIVPHFARHMWALAGRGACVVAFVAAVGAGLALLLRNTVAALGVVIGYFIVGEGIIGSLRHGDVRHHLVQSRLIALLDGTYSWFVPVRGVDGSIGFGSDQRRTVHALEAGVELFMLSILLLALATVALQRRDVT